MGLCIGTVQFGMDYGVQGGKRPPLEDSLAMLDYATQNGVDAIDTAAAYGTAEEVVGEFLARRTLPRESLQVISKFGTKIFEGADAAAYPAHLRSAAETSLRRLRTDYLDAYICHDPVAAGNPAIIDAMATLKSAGLARHVGFSVYETSEAMACIPPETVDFVQAPFSILDQRMKTGGFLSAAAARGIDVHTRSAFVQGLMLMPLDAIPERLAATRPFVAELEAACVAHGITRRTLAIAYVRSQPQISHIVFGVDNIGQLKEIVHDFGEDVPAGMIEEIAARFTDIDQSIFMPNKWRK